jgi:hypothetical protein
MRALRRRRGAGAPDCARETLALGLRGSRATRGACAGRRSRPPRRADELWRHTCCELFLAERGRAGYHEFNFAPSTEWAIYRFQAYREGMAVVENAGRLRVASRVRADRLELTAAIDLGALSPRLTVRRFALGRVGGHRGSGRTLLVLGAPAPAGPARFSSPGRFRARARPDRPGFRARVGMIKLI